MVMGADRTVGPAKWVLGWLVEDRDGGVLPARRLPSPPPEGGVVQAGAQGAGGARVRPTEAGSSPSGSGREAPWPGVGDEPGGPRVGSVAQSLLSRGRERH